MKNDVIIEQSLSGFGKDVYKDFVGYVYCEEGNCTLKFHSTDCELTKGDFATIRKVKLVSEVKLSDDFKGSVLYISQKVIDRCSMITNYGINGFLKLWLTPVIHLNDEQRLRCKRAFELIIYRLSHPEHEFHEDVLLNATQSALLDFLDFESEAGFKPNPISQGTALVAKFIAMLNNGEYRRHRELTYYSSRLFVTSKYLSDISKRSTGFPANYWINRYTSQDILRHLRNKSYSISQISELFHFSSPSYFSRYVLRNLGKNPSELRD